MGVFHVHVPGTATFDGVEGKSEPVVSSDVVALVTVEADTLTSALAFASDRSRDVEAVTCFFYSEESNLSRDGRPRVERQLNADPSDPNCNGYITTFEPREQDAREVNA